MYPGVTPAAEFAFGAVAGAAWSSAGRISRGGENPYITHYCIAIDDGEREDAWVLIVANQIYARCRAGMIVHVQIDPRRHSLIAMSAAGPTPAPAGQP